MKTDKTSLIIISLVVFITGLAFGNLATSSSFTGQISRPHLEKPSITVSPEYIFPGENIEITIISGKNSKIYTEQGVVYFYTITDSNELGVRKSRTWQICHSGITCDKSGTFEYNIPNIWSPGKYAAVIIDAVTGEKIWDDFTVGYVKVKGYT